VFLYSASALSRERGYEHPEPGREEQNQKCTVPGCPWQLHGLDARSKGEPYA